MSMAFASTWRTFSRAGMSASCCPTRRCPGTLSRRACSTTGTAAMRTSAGIAASRGLQRTPQSWRCAIGRPIISSPGRQVLDGVGQCSLAHRRYPADRESGSVQRVRGGGRSCVRAGGPGTRWRPVWHLGLHRRANPHWNPDHRVDPRPSLIPLSAVMVTAFFNRSPSLPAFRASPIRPTFRSPCRHWGGTS
jgi:hypothetical protein